MSQSIHKRIKDDNGFTLVEMIMVMALFMGIIIISSQAFNKIITVASQQTKSSESDTQGVIGLEMLRLDLEHAGYGLPWIMNFPAEFNEVDTDPDYIAPGIDSKDFNDTKNISNDPNKVPRAIQAGTATSANPSENNRDYLVIKSVLAGVSNVTKRWTYVENVGNVWRLKTWGGGNDFAVDDRVITIDSRTKRLIGGTGTAPANFSYSITAPNMTPPNLVNPPDSTTANFQPQLDTDVYVVYGVSTVNLRAPYNRVDYYVKRPAEDYKMPARCAPGTGILYKGVMNHTGGGFNQYPLLECVADMQVVFTVAADGVNGVDVDQSGLTGLTAKEIREQLKAIKIYIVAHEGGKDTNFNYASQTRTIGDGNGRTLDFKNDIVGSDDYKYYRWKMYKLVVIPRNINY